MTPEDCPFMGRTIEFSNESEIIPISSSFYFPNYNPLPRNTSAIPCSWIFKLSTGYKLKIHINLLIFKDGQTLKLQRDKIGAVSLNDTGVYYFEGDTIVLTYEIESRVFNLTREPDFEFNGSEFGFGALISAVNINALIVNQNCTDKNGTFTNFNANKGYGNNVVSFFGISQGSVCGDGITHY